MSDIAERYRRIKSIFMDAMQRDPRDRADFLAESCGEDAELRRDVEALLADDKTSDMAHGRLNSGFDVPRLPPDYVAVRELGRGGMGVVWLAERTVGDVQQKVALKLLSYDALRDPDRHARFRVERHILASLDHPHIARLLDGGTLTDGTPFLAMEYVEGERLDAWCKSRRPKLKELLRLFVAICRAVQAAHQRLVVHRDLKPANILVDTYGAPKLLDFGIAKLLDDSGDAESVTGTGLQLMTPRYAAPEQVRGETITTATDVYALGVILYEMLTGKSPYGPASAAPDQLRAICDTDPIRPSKVVLADAASGSVGMPRVQLRGDLDAILLKCLRKRPGSRYRGAAELADDLEAFLDGRPVSARAGNARYVLGKFVARHRYLVGSTLMLITVLGVATLLLMRQLDATRVQRDIAATERDKSEQVAQLLVDLLRNADPAKAKGLQITVRDALVQGEAELDRRLTRYPDTRAYLYRQLALIHAELGDAEHALVLAQRAVGALAAADAREVSIDERAQVRFALALALVRNGRGKEALAMLVEVERDAAISADVLLQVDALSQQAVIAAERLDTAAATALHERSKRLLLDALAAPDLSAAARGEIDETRRPLLERLAGSGQTQCGALADAYETEAAMRTCSATAELKKRLWPPDHPAHLNTKGTLAMLAGMRGDNDAALQMRRDVLESTRRIYGNMHVRTGYAAFNLAVTLKEMRQYDQAQALYREALTILRDRLGPEHRSTLVVQNNLAVLLTDIGDPAGGLAMHQEVFSARRRALGEPHADVAQSLMNIATAESALGRVPDAIRDVEAARRMYQTVHGDEHHDVTLATMMLARYQLSAGQLQQAETNARTALAAYDKRQDEPDERGATEFLLARIEWALGQHEVALTRARASLAQARQHGGSGFEPELIEAWLAERDGASPQP